MTTEWTGIVLSAIALLLMNTLVGGSLIALVSVFLVFALIGWIMFRRGGGRANKPELMARGRRLGAFLLLLFAAWAVAMFLVLPKKIKMEIRRANYCETAADCQVLPGSCSLGFRVVVNKNEAQWIRRIMPYGTMPELFSPMACSIHPPDEVVCTSDRKCQMNYR